MKVYDLNDNLALEVSIQRYESQTIVGAITVDPFPVYVTETRLIDASGKQLMVYSIPGRKHAFYTTCPYMELVYNAALLGGNVPGATIFKRCPDAVILRIPRGKTCDYEIWAWEYEYLGFRKQLPSPAVQADALRWFLGYLPRDANGELIPKKDWVYR